MSAPEVSTGSASPPPHCGGTWRDVAVVALVVIVSAGLMAAAALAGAKFGKDIRLPCHDEPARYFQPME
jgi:hypothetical protein